MNYSQIWDIPAKDLPKRAQAIWSTPLTSADSEKTNEDSLGKTQKNEQALE